MWQTVGFPVLIFLLSRGDGEAQDLLLREPLLRKVFSPSVRLKACLIWCPHVFCLLTVPNPVACVSRPFHLASIGVFNFHYT